MTSRPNSYWVLLGSSGVAGLLAALACGYLAAMAPLAGIDRFALAAMSIPTVWVLVSLHIMLATRPFRWIWAYSIPSVALLIAVLARIVAS